MESRRAAFIDQVFDAIDDDDALKALPRSICDAVGAETSNLVLVSSQGSEVIGTHGIDDKMMLDYKDYFWTKDIWSKEYLNLKMSNVISSDRFISHRRFINSEFYVDFLKPNCDLYYCAGFINHIDRDNLLLFGAHRTRIQSQYTEEEESWISGVKPLLENMMRARSRATTARSTVALEIVDASRDARFVVAADGRLLFANVCGQAILNQGHVFSRAGPQLIGTQAPFAAAFAKAVRLAAAGRGGQTLATGPCDRPWRIEIDRLPDRRAARVLIRVCDLEARLTHRLMEACERLQLSRAEYALAESLMRGLSPAQHAQSKGVRMPTVRSQLASLYAKAGVAGHAQLLLALWVNQPLTEPA